MTTRDRMLALIAEIPGAWRSVLSITGLSNGRWEPGGTHRVLGARIGTRR